MPGKRRHPGQTHLKYRGVRQAVRLAPDNGPRYAPRRGASGCGVAAARPRLRPSRTRGYAAARRTRTLRVSPKLAERRRARDPFLDAPARAVRFAHRNLPHPAFASGAGEDRLGKSDLLWPAPGKARARDRADGAGSDGSSQHSSVCRGFLASWSCRVSEG